MPKDYKNYIDLHTHPTGENRRIEMLSDIMQSGTFLPKTVELKDIDEAFKTWTESLKITSDDGIEFQTMVLFSNQRFSEYTQSWKFTDVHNNLLLNFKTITRENNPQFGKIHNGLWNIPGKDRFYTMKKQIVLDDNGTESLLYLQMRQPVSIDLNYKLSIFTTQYHSLNEFNTLINKEFASRQCYIKPNEHFMPMTLEGISDESSYSIDDRQFYGQTYNIKVMAYLITEDDYRVEEIPLKHGVTIPMMGDKQNIPDVEISECEDNDNITIMLYYPNKCTKTIRSFTIDIDAEFDEVKLENLFNNYKIYVNGEEIDKTSKFAVKNGDVIKINASKQIKNEEAKLFLLGKNTEN